MDKKKRNKEKRYRYKGKWKIAAVAVLVVACIAMFSGHPNDVDKGGAKVVAYLPYWSADSFDSDAAEKITHLNIAFVNPDPAGNLSIDIPEKKMKQIIRKAHKHDVKVMMSLGGGNGYDNYTALISTSSGRKNLTDNIIDYAKKYKFDGIDINIEGNVENEFWSNYEDWIQLLRKSCDRKDMLLTCAVATWFDSCITDNALKAFDIISVMAYDNREAYNHSSYEYAVSQIEYFSDRRHIDEDKLVIGIPFYGYRYSNGVCTGEAVTFGEIAKYNENSQHVDESGTCRYNGIDTVKKKTELGLEYGGVMVWSLGQDASGEYSLLKAIADTIK